MARRVQVVLEDDLDGGDADRTVEFSFDGTRYEIDLNAANIARLSAAVAPFAEVARQVGSGRGRSTRSKTSRGRGTSTNQNQAIREWARGQGMQVSERGRISAEVTEAYSRAH